MNRLSEGDAEMHEPRTTREVIDDMPTPKTTGGVFALFAALEMEAMEDGRSTLEESKERLAETFSPPTDQPE